MKAGAGFQGGATASFWPFIRSQLTWHEQERFGVLRKVQTDQGRGRAWLRAALNERSLERHFHSIVAPAEALEQHYEDWGYLRDQDRSALLPNVAAGLTTILFAIRVDNEELDQHNSEKSHNSLLNTQHDEPIIHSALPGTVLVSLYGVRCGRVWPTYPQSFLSKTINLILKLLLV